VTFKQVGTSLYAQKGGDNTIHCFDQNFVMKTVPVGADSKITKDPNYTYRQMRFNYTGDDYAWTVYSGNLYFIAYLPNVNKYSNVKEFWISPAYEGEEDARFTLQPLMGVANHSFNKQCGLGVDVTGQIGNEPGTRFICFYLKEPGQNMGDNEYYKESEPRFAKHFTKVNCMETSLNEDVLFMAGERSGKGVVAALTFDLELNVVTSALVDADIGRCSSVSAIRRFVGTDWLILGGQNLIFIYAYSNKEFKMMKFIEVPGCQTVAEIRVRFNKILILDQLGNLFLRRAAKRLDTNNGNAQEYGGAKAPLIQAMSK
jgi:hypothetical protein